MKKLTLITYLLFTASVLFIGCSKEDMAAPPDFRGVWTGITSQGNAISFKVDSNQVMSLKIEVDVKGNCNHSGLGREYFLNFPILKVINEYTFKTSAGQDLLNGTFTSSESANGEFYFVSEGNPFGCRSVGQGTWTARKM